MQFLKCFLACLLAQPQQRGGGLHGEGRSGMVRQQTVEQPPRAGQTAVHGVPDPLHLRHTLLLQLTPQLRDQPGERAQPVPAHPPPGDMQGRRQALAQPHQHPHRLRIGGRPGVLDNEPQQFRGLPLLKWRQRQADGGTVLHLVKRTVTGDNHQALPGRGKKRDDLRGIPRVVHDQDQLRFGRHVPVLPAPSLELGRDKLRLHVKGLQQLRQGFPDTDGPESVREAAVQALRDGRGNQPPATPRVLNSPLRPEYGSGRWGRYSAKPCTIQAG